MSGQADLFLLLIVAFIFPPLAVAFVAGCGADLCLNILLTFLGYLPGCIHACWLVFQRAEANKMYGYKNWTYFGMGEYVPVDGRRYSGVQSSAPAGQPPPPPPPPPPSQAPVDQKPGGYAAPPTHPEQKNAGYQAQAPAPAPAPVPAPAPAPAPADQTAVRVIPPTPADQKQADPTASPSGT